jgi:hypothetical protein
MNRCLYILLNVNKFSCVETVLEDVVILKFEVFYCLFKIRRLKI